MPRLESRQRAVRLNKQTKRRRSLDKFHYFSPFMYMIGDMIALFKARKDIPLAKRIASDMVVDGAIDRASWPLAIAKFWMVIGIIGLGALTALFLWGGIAAHWALAIPAFLFGGLTYLIIRIWRGLNRGVQAVTELAKTELGKRADAIKMPIKRSENNETLSP